MEQQLCCRGSSLAAAMPVPASSSILSPVEPPSSKLLTPTESPSKALATGLAGRAVSWAVARPAA